MEKIKFNGAAITPIIDRMMDASVALYTHSGRFHADEVYCTALILLATNSYSNINNPIPVKCTPDMVKNMGLKRIPKVTDDMINDINNNKIIVYDLLGGQIDHHDVNDKHIRPGINEKITEPYVPCYASLGRMWNEFGFGDLFNIKSNLTTDVKTRIDRDFIFPIDMVDNYGPNCPVVISQRSEDISSMNIMDEDFIPDEITLSDEEKAETGLTKQFIYAVCVAYNILRNAIISTQAAVKAVNNIEDNNLINHNDNNIPYILVPEANEGEKPLFVNTQAAAEIELDDEEYCYPVVIVNNNPSERDGTFNVVCTDSSVVRFDRNFLKNRPEGCQFIHKNLFLMTFDTLENQMEFVKNSKIINGVIVDTRQ